MTKEQSLRKRAEELWSGTPTISDIEKALLQVREEAIREAAYIAGGSAGNDILALLNEAKKTKEGKKA